ncbi:glycoside hydrolase family 3 protein [Actinoplanes oblitus]|uniref:beta-N-acetylhexosaminidase n=1 Tax=Actinoplanes oblitus TaxID=3040509 RepID=A0ABY8WNY9_9ACTN|nr:glycoside hydrolase family 3 protein [Actinoplanes oblitus]WIM99596.1 glycoside hydrolase family 3 protein [Actinoplanes oblitus]
MRTRPVALLALAALSVTLLAAPANASSPIDSIVARMTLPEKVGQLFTTYVYGNDATAASPDNRRLYGVDTPAEVVKKYHLGGVIYFAWTNSLQNIRQITTLSNGLQAAAEGVPLTIATDQEHGVVSRMPAPATQFPGGMALGAGRDPIGAFRTGQVTGQELRAVGINQAWAPDADVNVNPANPVIGVRSFGSDPGLVATMTASQILGLQLGANTSAAAKHFPGHGDTATDSHTGLPVITHTRAEWERIDAPPFKAAVAAGVDAIMSAHIVVPALDPSGDPATLSQPIITGLLREELGYRGVIVTDSLEMAGVRERYGDDRVPVLALKAGVDMLLMPPNFDVAYHAVLDAVASGELTEGRIDQSVRRILALKQKRGLLTWTPLDPAAAEASVGSAAHLTIAQSVTDRSVTAIRNDAGLLPYPATGKSILVTGASAVTSLATALHATPLVTASTDEAVAAARDHDLTVVLTNNVSAGSAQQALVKALIATGRPIVVVAVRNPYDLTRFPEAATYLATYSTTAVSMRSLAKVITGGSAPRGKLPVEIPGLYPYGHGLTWSVT